MELSNQQLDAIALKAHLISKRYSRAQYKFQDAARSLAELLEPEYNPQFTKSDREDIELVLITCNRLASKCAGVKAQGVIADNIQRFLEESFGSLNK